VTLAADGLVATTVNATNEFQDVPIVLPPRSSSGAVVTITSSSTIVPGPSDPRQLGVQLDRVACAPQDGRPWPPVATIVYARFKSVIAQEPTARRLIPAPIEDAPQAGPAAGTAVYDYEPDEAEILADLLPRNVSVQIFRALLENAASEQGARMSAMDSATRNAGDVIDRLTLQYNRSRQAMITKELIEIISGAEAI